MDGFDLGIATVLGGWLAFAVWFNADALKKQHFQWRRDILIPGMILLVLLLALLPLDAKYHREREILEQQHSTQHPH